MIFLKLFNNTVTKPIGSISILSISLYIFRNVSLSLLARGAVEGGVSATQVREFIMNDDNRLKQVVPTSVYENRDSIKQLITLSKLKQ